MKLSPTLPPYASGAPACLISHIPLVLPPLHLHLRLKVSFLTLSVDLYIDEPLGPIFVVSLTVVMRFTQLRLDGGLTGCCLFFTCFRSAHSAADFHQSKQGKSIQKLMKMLSSVAALLCHIGSCLRWLCFYIQNVIWQN